MQLQEKGDVDDLDKNLESLESSSLIVSLAFTEVSSDTVTSQSGHEDAGMDNEMCDPLLKRLTAKR